MSGKHRTRTEWAVLGASDMLSTGVRTVDGCAPTLNGAIHVESLHMSLQVHGIGAGNVAVAGATPNFYERAPLSVPRPRTAEGLLEPD